jgi:hypothetical protein
LSGSTTTLRNHQPSNSFNSAGILAYKIIIKHIGIFIPIVSSNAPGSSPVSTLTTATANMPVGVAAATYTIPASDPDANATPFLVSFCKLLLSLPVSVNFHL